MIEAAVLVHNRTRKLRHLPSTRLDPINNCIFLRRIGRIPVTTRYGLETKRPRFVERSPQFVLEAQAVPAQPNSNIRAACVGLGCSYIQYGDAHLLI